MQPDLESVLVIVKKLLQLVEAQGQAIEALQTDVKAVLDILQNPKPAPPVGIGVDPGKPTG